MLLATIFASIFGLSLLLTPLARRFALRWGFVDQPDGRCKLHEEPIPVSGGIAVLLALALGLLATVVTLPAHQLFPIEWPRYLLGMLLGTLVIAVVGLADDLCCLR